jgi:hypothetical protein
MKRLAIRLSPQAGKSLVFPQAGEGMGMRGVECIAFGFIPTTLTLTLSRLREREMFGSFKIEAARHLGQDAASAVNVSTNQ